MVYIFIHSIILTVCIVCVFENTNIQGVSEKTSLYNFSETPCNSCKADRVKSTGPCRADRLRKTHKIVRRPQEKWFPQDNFMCFSQSVSPARTGWFYPVSPAGIIGWSFFWDTLYILWVIKNFYVNRKDGFIGYEKKWEKCSVDAWHTIYGKVCSQYPEYDW